MFLALYGVVGFLMVSFLIVMFCRKAHFVTYRELKDENDQIQISSRWPDRTYSQAHRRKEHEFSLHDDDYHHADSINVYKL